LDKNNEAKSRNISIKQKLPNLYVVESGLSANDKIILEGLQSVKEDEKVFSEFVPAKVVIGDLQLIK
jgi:membrane fusion protein (multidrug efflux system)